MKSRLLPCTDCGRLRDPGGKSTKTTITCMDCRNAKHGTHSQYGKGCRCDECRAFMSEYMKVQLEKYRTEHGVNPSTVWRRKTGNYGDCYGGWITQERRIAIYERDGWICHLCSEPVDMSAGYNEKLAATLDHLLPRSKGGTDEESNLRTSHRHCNSMRQDRDLVAA